MTKQTISFSRMLWNSETREMFEHKFVLNIDTDKLPPKLLRKVRDNKMARASMAYGALIIKDAENGS